MTYSRDKNYKKPLPRKKSAPLKIVPVGGCEEFGKNLTCYQMDKEFIVVDAGAVFPDPSQLGVSTLIPHVNKIFRQLGKVLAYHITHGHEDHIGALPFIYQAFPAPIYATPWTCELLKKKFLRYGVTPKDINVVQCEQKITSGPFNIEYVHMSHSIPDASSLFIRTASGNSFHSGDFKIDRHPNNPAKINAKQINRISQIGVDTLLTDSTNSYKEGFTPSEQDIFKPLEKLITNAPGRVFLASFSSNFWRVKTVFDICKKLNKKLVVNGRSLSDCLEIGKRLGKIEDVDKTVIRVEQQRNYSQNKLVFLVSGTQGEENASLTRISDKSHRQVQINKKDTVVFSARAIPGNEKRILEVMEQLKKQGANVITPQDVKNIHVSGHAHSEDLKYLTKRLKPKLYIPVHGSSTFLIKNKEMIEKAFKDTETMILNNGEILEISNHKFKKSPYKMEIEHLYVDQDSQIPMKLRTLKDRLDSGEQGYACVSGVVSRSTRKWTSGPDIEFFGIEDRVNMLRASHRMSQRLKEALEKEEQLSQEQLQEYSYSFLKKSILKQYKKRPKILSKVYLV